MTSNEILKADMLDILFDNRNKQYGAYALRKTYNNRLGIALGISLSTVLLVFFLMRIDNSSRDSIRPVDKDVVTIRDIAPLDIKKPEPIIPKQTTPSPAIKQTAFVNPVIKEDPLVKNPMAAQTDLINSLISDQNKDGIAFNDIPVIKEAVTDKPTKEEHEKVIETVPSREPEFPGGQQAWLNFLQKYLIAPEELEPGEKKMVSIRFSVSEDGVVNNFQIIQSAGASYDNEVIRVLKKMPKWKPAIQNGQPVARAFTQPVTFMGLEQ